MRLAVIVDLFNPIYLKYHSHTLKMKAIKMFASYFIYAFRGRDYATYSSSIFGLATLTYSTAPGAFQAFVVGDDLEAGAFQPCNSGIVECC